MDNHNILFSVVIPTRNRPVEFKKALDSVLMQSFKSYEVIVVNDGTTSEYRKSYDDIKASCAENITFINLIERSRGHGHCFARNQGVDIAKGKFICFLDDDDWWLDNSFLERAAAEIKKHHADFYFANQKAITHDGKHINNVWVENLPEKLNPTDPRLQQTVYPVEVKELLLATGFPHMNCWAISTALYNKIGGMDENLRYEPDRDIYLRALDKAQCILYDTTIAALHNIPEKSKKNNASTLTNIIEKILFQLRTIDKGILFLSNKTLVQFCIIRKGFLLKKLTEQLVKEKKYNLAFLYARQALAVSFTLKWLLYTGFCYFKKIIFWGGGEGNNG